MAILKKEKKTNYTIISNNIFKDKSLSLKAKGLLCLMLSLPDMWEFTEQGLATLSADGLASTKTAIKELENAGYLRREQIRNDGKYSNSEYIISSEPKSKKSLSKKPICENTISVNRPQLNTYQLNTYLSNKDNALNKHNTNNLSNDIERVKERGRFSPPTLPMVNDYIRDKGYHVDGEAFINFYESKGWMVGKNKMKDWKSALATWERRHAKEHQTKKNANPYGSNPYLELLHTGDY